MNAGLYIHIPFCLSKCDYCDFLSFENSGRHVQEAYVKALLNEMSITRARLAGTDIDTVYIGGGTPTALPPLLLREILQEIRRYPLTHDAEFTVEANPGTWGTEPGGILSVLKEGGVNRLSIGLQAGQDRLLKTIGRIHTARGFADGYDAARKIGFNNISVDLMFGLPFQRMEDWRESLAYLIRLAPEHISAYSLTPEEGTRLYARLNSGELSLPGEETERAMYALARQMLADAGYRHYEISNFARPGRESRHNNRYWKRSPYYGLGLGAHSFNAAARWHNTDDMDRYISAGGAPPREGYETLTARDAMAETMFLGLRLAEGILRAEFKHIFEVPLDEVYGEAVKKLTARNLLRDDGEKISLTILGMDLANQVFLEFL